MVGRFQVMALLQAARAKSLGYPLDEAESFGLNRAIFYAAAKRGVKGTTSAKYPGKQVLSTYFRSLMSFHHYGNFFRQFHQRMG